MNFIIVMERYKLSGILSLLNELYPNDRKEITVMIVEPDFEWY